MQITPNSPIRRPIIRFLLAVRRKKGSAPVISTDFHPVQRLDGPPSPSLLDPLSPRGRDVTGHRSTEISAVSNRGFLLRGILLSLCPSSSTRRHAQNLLKRSTASEGFFASPLHIGRKGGGGWERKHGVHRERNPSKLAKCIEEIVCDPDSGLSATHKVTFRIGRPLSMRPTPLDRFEEFRISGTAWSWRDSRGGFKFGDNVWGRRIEGNAVV